MDRYTKIIQTGILIALISIAAKDVDLFPIAEAQQGWEIDNEIAMTWSHSDYLLSENQMLTFYDLASRAADTGQRVRYSRCTAFKTSCLRYITFRGDPTDVAD